MYPITVADIGINEPDSGIPIIKMIRTEKRKPRWDPHPEKSKTDNSEWRLGFFVIFEGGGFDWMPKNDEIDKFSHFLGKDQKVFVIFENKKYSRKYLWIPSKDEIKEIIECKGEIEMINKELARKNFYKM